jgi:hypothetical protein
MMVMAGGCKGSPAPLQLPTGRVLPGVVRCDEQQRCADGGACFISLFDRAPTCAGAGQSPCDVMQCDAPATCRCLKTTPVQCGCAITMQAQ